MISRIIKAILSISAAAALPFMASAHEAEAQASHTPATLSCAAVSGTTLVMVGATPTCLPTPTTVQTVDVHGQGNIKLADFATMFAGFKYVQVTKASITALGADAPKGYLFWDSQTLTLEAFTPAGGIQVGSIQCFSTGAGVNAGLGVCPIAGNVNTINYIDGSGNPQTFTPTKPVFGGRPQNPTLWWILEKM